MNSTNALILAGSVATPFLAKYYARPETEANVSKATLITSGVSAAVFFLTGSAAAGALALGSGAAWAVMKYKPGWPK